MSTEVVMPQMGESIAEGTITRWLKQVGEQVERDEPLFEISTDKVDAEIPSPGAGVLSEIKVKEGETVPVNSVVAVIGAAGEAVSAAEAPAADSSSEPAVPAAAAGQPETASNAAAEESGEQADEDDTQGGPFDEAQGEPSTDELRRQRSSGAARHRSWARSR